MTVAELIYELEQFDEELEVRLMEQPTWPFEYSINGVTDRRTIEKDEMGGEPQEEIQWPAGTKAPNTVFITEGNQLCYGNKFAWGVL